MHVVVPDAEYKADIKASQDWILHEVNATRLTDTTSDEELEKKPQDRRQSRASGGKDVRADQSFGIGVVSSSSEEDGVLPRIAFY
jgi:hypothetical protein